MNQVTIILASIIALALIIFLVIRNNKDKKQFENQLKNDYRKPKKDKEDAEAEEDMK